MKIVKHDILGIGFSWGGPSDRTLRNQTGIEAFYSFQLTQHLNITPDFQLTIHPSFNDEKDIIAIYSVVRIRFAI
jgi:hypothetical protein